LILRQRRHSSEHQTVTYTRRPCNQSISHRRDLDSCQLSVTRSNRPRTLTNNKTKNKDHCRAIIYISTRHSSAPRQTPLPAFRSTNPQKQDPYNLKLTTMAPVWAIPVGCLGGLVVAGLIVLWWWFPRAWQKGINSDHDEYTGAGQPGANSYTRELQRQRNRAIIERHTRKIARERGEPAPADDADLELALNWGREPVEQQAPPPIYTAQPKMATGQTHVAN
jgi:hypothetical protein